MVIFQKIKHRTTIQSSNPTSEYLHRKMESRDLRRYFYTDMHSSIIYNSQKVEATQVPVDR